MYLKLLVSDNDGKECWVNFSINIEAVQGFYDDPDDVEVVNLISYGQLYTVKRKPGLMARLKYDIN